MSDANLFDLLLEIKSLVASGKTAAAIGVVDRLESSQAAELYDRAQRSFYWDDNNIAAMIAVSHAGIKNLLSAADRIADLAEAAVLRGKAKTLAYNLGSFTWPGWGESGVTLSAADIAAGLDAARLNLKLAEELNRPPKVHANAFWLLGAHHLAAGEHQYAADAFVLGQVHADEAAEPLVGQMLEAYTRLANALATPGDDNSHDIFDAAIKGLMKVTSPGATEYANQLRTAAAVFGIRK